MITKAEALRIQDIKMRALTGRHVTNDERQFVLDIARREQEPIDRRIVANAEAAGFDVYGIVTI